MQNVLVYGKEKAVIAQLVKQEGLTVLDEQAGQPPDVIITHGGDGYLLETERLYPGVPKLPIRYNSVCKTCIDHDTTHAIKAMARGTISKTTVHKIQTTVNDKIYTALNEFSIHHVAPNQAIRFTVQINDDPHTQPVIGDGLIIATPFGSHAYYRSITSGTFRLGIGVAYNNSTEPIDHMVVRDTDQILVTVTRGPVYFLVDNDPELTQLEVNQSFTVKLSAETAMLLGIEHFRCPDCDEPMPQPDPTAQPETKREVTE